MYRRTGSGCSWTRKNCFVPFSEFPWFMDASIREISHVELPSPHHLYWPDFDIDLAVESLMHPERYPLVSQTPPKRRVQAKPLRRTANTRASRSRLRS